MLMRLWLLSVFSVVLVALALPVPTKSQSPEIQLAQRASRHATAASSGEVGKVASVNDWTVGIAGGLLEGTFIRFAAELAKALDDGDNLRVLPIVSYGAAENVSDLLYLRGVDMAITYSDDFDQYKKSGSVKNIEQRVNYISQLYIGEFHVFARPEIKTLADLDGKKVGFNTKGAGPTITGPIVFERLGIHVEPVFINNAVAIEKMKTGEIAAILHTVGKPNDLFTKLQPIPGFHFVPVEYDKKLFDYYLPSTLSHDDYPNLIPEGESIETIGIPAVLAVFNWQKGSDRYRRVERFIDYYFDHYDRLKQPSFHPKWKDVNLAATVPGWTRYSVAEQKLRGMVSGSLSPRYSDDGDTRRPSNGGSEDRLQKFLNWKREHVQQQ
ncbi:MAG: C4-dicarboxylate ABC transporter [Bradyrhizobium sp.]|uniref:TAXI family TRAP transporter solute-binding subunit n=1 Tax=Bradyrhizobium sp. TaxID=376 RepID=UPI001DEB07E4|nr:TAXI family TRAP transporter solute-binding subunit [Bradyrhizobium sp.]MBV9563414.1 C4-dicarboxylate ABC transporter [Bradyrhizobium sp.]